LEKVDGSFQKAMKKEEVFALPPEREILLKGPDLFELTKEAVVKAGVRVRSNRAFIVYREEKID